MARYEQPLKDRVARAAATGKRTDDALMLAYDQRLVAAFTIARHLDVHRAIVSEYSVAAGAVALIALADGLGFTVLVAECSVISALIAR